MAGKIKTKKFRSGFSTFSGAKSKRHFGAVDSQAEHRAGASRRAQPAEVNMTVDVDIKNFESLAVQEFPDAPQKGADTFPYLLPCDRQNVGDMDYL